MAFPRSWKTKDSDENIATAPIQALIPPRSRSNSRGKKDIPDYKETVDLVVPKV